MEKKERALRIIEALKADYPEALCALHSQKDYELMIAVRLSAQCTDERVNLITPALFARFPTLESFAEADVTEVEELVRSCGFYKHKARDIVAACRMLLTDYGGRVPDSMEELLKLPGVGRKTANVVLAFSFGVPAIPVDTHVFRVANRLGLSDALTVEETEKQLMALIPRDTWSQAHHWLIYHGRRVCHSQKPDCESCALRSDCKAAREGRMINPKAEAKKRAQARKARAESASV